MNEEFEFIKETKKNKPFNRKKWFLKLLSTAFFALVFGVIAGIVMGLIVPYVTEQTMPEETEPRFEFVADDEQPLDLEPVEETPKPDSSMVPAEEIIVENPSAEGEEPAEPEPTPLENYINVQNELFNIGGSLDSSIVSVQGNFGIIIAKSNTNLLILTEKKNIEESDEIEVSFADETISNASLVRYDAVSGIAIIKIALSDLSRSTKERITVAELGNSAIIKRGDVVLAVGSPNGVSGTVLTGSITSVRNTVSVYDFNYPTFTTDMMYSKDGQGAVVNTDGQIVGFILESVIPESNTLSAVSITQLKGVIELLTNDAPVPYLGMKVSTVTVSMSEKYDIPPGVYVNETAWGSPAVAAGIQSGDVITYINDITTSTVYDYQRVVRSLSENEKVKIVYQRASGKEYITLSCELTAGVLE
ncbi:MAG: S1C family serine protease [Lachnospiraceae bacterium]|nr:S1C family serine protease [Lachnospiraceae bacterium]